jgi:hypothetical protein
VYVTAHFSAAAGCVFAERIREFRKQIRFRAKVTDLRAFAAIRRAHAATHFNPIKAMEGIAFDYLRFDAFAPKNMCEALHDGGGSGAR